VTITAALPLSSAERLAFLRAEERFSRLRLARRQSLRKRKGIGGKASLTALESGRAAKSLK